MSKSIYKEKIIKKLRELNEQIQEIEKQKELLLSLLKEEKE